MNLSLTSTHIETIHDLQEIATKHNCRIRIDFIRNNISPEEYEDCILDSLDMNEDVKKQFISNYNMNNTFYRHDYVVYELIDMRKPNWHHNCLFYHDFSFYFTFKEKSPMDLELDSDNYVEKSQELEDWINDNIQYNNFYGKDYTKDDVVGFEGTNTKVNVYREGMALKFFSDLVCDYLKEPRIVRPY